jgi:hypothetical protein
MVIGPSALIRPALEKYSINTVIRQKTKVMFDRRSLK